MLIVFILFCILCGLIYVGISMTGVLLKAMFWACVKVPCAVFVIAVGIMLHCTILLIPIGLKLIRLGLRIMIP